MYLKSIVLAVIFLQVINKAASLKCYSCRGPLSSPCGTNLTQGKFERDCDAAATTSEPPLQAELSRHSNASFDAGATMKFHCIAVKLTTLDSRQEVARDCAPINTTCEAYMSAAEKVGHDIFSCQSCSSDLCNTLPAIDAPPSGNEPLKCYSCSGSDECQTNPRQVRFEKVCTFETMRSSASPLQAKLFSHLNASFAAHPRMNMEFNCFSMRRASESEQMMQRDCVPKFATCGMLHKAAEESGLAPSDCKLCDTELCNSSSAINAGVYSLVFCCFVAIFSSLKR